MPELTAGRKRERLKGLGRTMILVILLWTVAVVSSLLWTTSQKRSHAIQLATDKARTILAKDIALRRWATSHGGVYVPASDRTPPNPLLSHLPERDITTPSGRRLTLMNPAYMLRQIVTDFSAPSASAHLSSLKPMRPENTPDPWEVEGLRSFEKGSREVADIQKGATGEVVRVMQPFLVDTPNCLTCHGSSGYRLGDVRGGLSATVTLGPYLELVGADQRAYRISHGLIWLLGMAGIGVAGLRSRRQFIRLFENQEKLAESSRFLEGIIDAIQDLVVVIDRDYQVVLSNWQGVPPERRKTGGRPILCHDCLGERNTPCDDCHLPDVFAGRKVVREAVSPLDGRCKEITVYPFRDASGAITMAIEVMKDISERKVMEQALLESEARFRRFAEHAQDILYCLRLGPSPAFEYVSPAIKALSSHSPQEWVADVNLCLRLVHPEDLPILRSILEGTVPAGGTFTLRFVRASGETVWTEHRTTTVMGADGRPAALEGIARDISRQVEASQKVQSFNRELERRVAERTTRLDQATREMEEFCYTISHDFKGPLRAINGYTHILEESCGQHSGHAERGLTMQKIKKAAAHMGELMDLLLELGRISRVPFAQESVDVTALCRRITLKLQERDPGRNAIFTVADEMTATADPAMLERLLQILLENAWNFTAAKPAAVIEVNRVVTDRMVVFNVRDNGVGFNMAYAANLFKPFQRLHRPEEHGGMGMGLAVARRIVERHGGRIWGEGEPGEGATFYFTLS